MQMEGPCPLSLPSFYPCRTPSLPMVKAGKYWKWPHLEDTIFFQKQNVQKKLNASKVVSSRVHSTLYL